MFDPYRKWLGISPKDQPPNHYRLLGIDQYEADLDVIDGAADRQMAFVRQYQSGEHAAAAARILNELAVARLCLLKPEKKVAYDEKLRREQAPNEPQPEAVLAHLPLADAEYPLPEKVRQRKKKSSKSKSASDQWKLLLGGGFAAILLIGAISLFDRRNDLAVEPQPSVPIVTRTPVIQPVEPQVKKQEPVPIVVAAPAIQRVEPPVKMPEPVPTPTRPSVSEPVGLVRTWGGALGISQFGVFNRDGTRLVYVKGEDVMIVDPVTGEHAVKLSGHTKNVSVARFSGDESRIVSVGQDETIRVWDTKTQQQISQIKAATTRDSSLLVVSKDAETIAFSSHDNRRLMIINTTTQTEIRKIELTEGQVYWRAVTADLKWGMSNGIRNQITIWDLSNKSSFTIDNGHHNYCGQFEHDGVHAMLAGANTWDRWRVFNRSKLAEGNVPGGHIYAVATIPNSTRFMTGQADGTVSLRDIETRKGISDFHGHEKPIACVVMSPDLKLAVSGDNSKVIKLWRLPD